MRLLRGAEGGPDGSAGEVAMLLLRGEYEADIKAYDNGMLLTCIVKGYS